MWKVFLKIKKIKKFCYFHWATATQRSRKESSKQWEEETDESRASERSGSGRRPCLVSLRVDGTQRKVRQQRRRRRRSQTPEDLRRRAEEEVEGGGRLGRGQRGREEEEGKNV